MFPISRMFHPTFATSNCPSDDGELVTRRNRAFLHGHGKPKKRKGEKTMESKKSIYAKHGIIYDGGKIESPVGKISPLLVNGNSKIGAGVWHFSTLPTNRTFKVNVCGEAREVRGTCPCSCVGCYATAGNFRYKSVKDSLAVRTVIAREFLDFMENAINAQIEADGVKIIRIHASGDFFCEEYANAWHRIAKKNANAIFWTYTKKREAESLFDDLPNANIVKSVIPSKGVNYGHCDYILACFEFLRKAGKRVYICRCGIDDNQHCVNCRGCANNDYVLFLEHSTAYKAKADPLFPVLKAVIEAQPAQA